MKFVNQHSILHSVYESLAPGASLIDGRTEQDWLRFLSEFAGLINFYDQTNSLNGNWEPFLLKDPVFLMAAISGTSYTKLYTLYLNTCHKLERLLAADQKNEDLSNSFNQLFDQLIGIFLKIRAWYHYMEQSVVDYPLKTYLATQIRATFANELQAIFSLREELLSTELIAGLLPLDPLVADKFFGYEARIWNEGLYGGPYWELLGLSRSIKQNSLVAIFKALTHIAEALFNFLQVIIRQANTEYGRLIKLKSSFPDTTLLRTFIELLKVQQAQLNGISEAHLRFYYKDILKQRERKAVADCAFLVAVLNSSDAVFSLPEGTLFDAGTDPEKNPIVFASTEEVVLNPAVIPMAQTLSRVPASNALSILQLQTIANPGVLEKDEEGKVLSWDTLGSHEPDPAAQQSLGIAFASPMLLLREGTRTLTISMSYTGEMDLNMLSAAQCYLSTQKDWLEVSPDFKLEEDTVPNPIIFTITLAHTDPAIESFLVNPDAVNSSWPMLKLVFHQVTGAKVSVPILQALKIDVDVAEMETFQLYNDYGALSTKVSFSPFGPSPAYGSNFILGSNEIFSKPVTSFQMQLNWAVLPIPPDFSTYYQAYNLYLNDQLKFQKTPDSCWWKKTFGKKKTPPSTATEGPYNNSCFMADFQILDEKNWQPVVFDSNDSSTGANLLYGTDDQGLSSFSSYATTAIPLSACDPALQNQPMKFTETSTAGFLRMELKGIDYGFGAVIYPNVVAAVTLYNSQILYNKQDQPFADAAQLPFTPKLQSLSVAYQASAQYVFNPESGLEPSIDTYPIQVFLYTPFTNYTVYDQANQPLVQKETMGDLEGSALELSGIPLYASFNYDGFLYLSVDSLIPASSFNIYFELARKYASSSTVTPQLEYYYLGTDGWAPLMVLADGTHHLSSSGIVTLNVPANITLESELMPKGCYWIVLAGNDVSQVAATVLLSTNGIMVQRSASSPEVLSQLNIAAGTITQTKKPFSKISSIQQPFPSFGTQVSEDAAAMNRRVSNRLKTKDRAVTAADYVTLMKQEFNDIYDAAVVFDALQQTINIYVVKAVDHWKSPHAFLPMVSIYEEAQLKLYLQKRTSAFSVLQVKNPDFQAVAVVASIRIQKGYEFLSVQQRLIQALNIYLSPWINDPGLQVSIYQDIDDTAVAAFIKTIAGVAAVETVFFKSWMYHPEMITAAAETTVLTSMVKPLRKSTLFISNLIHEISLYPSAI
ncbi:hypothetical protein AQ505_12195 [Pedobacter sp. PACM 27299]|uniref:hypothetical protein n=1 Tax=Pedobacter sp. PACM 27299 TaxID=1727164 RepID=UPI0007065934|nr:hypothetical protein [Pedobacter sp. PACM 27299]ALL06183.1 hypothetical protein AQ505_12195 [Pedobacter sp. PACM 27299]